MEESLIRVPFVIVSSQKALGLQEVLRTELVIG
jgi:hypothetical protein